MKRIILTLIAVVLGAGLASAQDLGQATETYNKGAEALNSSSKAAALEYFQKALKEAEACGDEGAEVAQNCKDIIPSIVLSISKDLVKEKKYDEALAKLAEAVKVAGEYGAQDVADEAETLAPQVKKSKALDLYNAKDFAAAAAAYKEVLADNPADGASALRLAMALNNASDKEGAIEAFLQAAENGQKDQAYKQLANIYLKDGQALLKDKKYKEALEACTKSNEYVESANAYKLSASAATQLKDNKKAIECYEGYLRLSPDAKDANGIQFTVAALYQQLGNKEKAKEYYNMVANDATYGAQAKQQLDALK